MDEERELRPRFARLLAALGAWTLAGISILMFVGESPLLGAIFAFVGLIVLMIAATGSPKRKRPYRRFELIALYIGFPLVFVTLIALMAVGFLPSTFAPWAALYLLVAALLFIMMILEARRHPEAH